MTLNQQILDAAERVAVNSNASDKLAAISQAATEYVNSNCTVDNAGDVWDARGNWWGDDRKEGFLAWLAAR